jgi:ligand-binding sensor domain-containing protein/signal transduction histidine kinase
MAQESGLSNGTVTAVAQGPAGFLWLGTEDGLNHYDGTGFTIYRPVSGDSTSLAHGWVTRILVSRDSTRWVGTLRGGLHRFIPGEQSFRRIQHIPGNPASLSSNQVNVLHESRGGVLWVGTPQGLDRLDPGTEQVRRYLPVDNDSTGYGNDVLAIAEDTAGLLWVGTRMGLFRLDPARGRSERMDLALHTHVVRELLCDRRGDLWIGTEDELLAIDPGTRAVRVRYGSATRARPSPFSGRVIALYEGPDGTIWVGSDGGLAALDPVTGDFVRHRYDREDPRSLGGNIVRSVLVDRGGVLWVGLESYGLSKHAPSAVHFDLIRHDPAAPRSLSDGYVRGITEGRAGDVWIATQFGGLNRLDRRTGRITAYRHRAGDPRSLPGDNVWALLQDRAGTFWVGLHDRGLGTFDPRTGTFTPSGLVPRDASVNLLYEDRSGALFVGLEGRGMLEISPDRRHVQSYGATTGDHPVLVHDDVQAILEDSRGMLWVGGVNGLTLLDRATGHATHFRGAPERPAALGADFVTNIVEDSRGTIWVATKGGGISRYEREAGRFTTFGTADGLPHSFVYGILEDARGNLWLSTDNGIAMFDPRTSVVIRYGLEDGLQAREFNRRAHYHSTDGTMYFGGINGVNFFRPDDAAPAPPPPEATFLTMRVGNGATRSIVRFPNDSAVHLGHNERAFSVTFVALDFSAPGKTRYAHRLEELDEDWVDTGNRGEATYMNVPPGRYVLRVAVMNASGVWNRDAASIAFVVARPWWGTWWARLLALLLFVGLPAAAAQMRLLAVRRRSALLERRVEEQTRDLKEAQIRLRAALERERNAGRELFEITASVPGAVFQLREAPDGSYSFPFVSEGIVTLCPECPLGTRGRKDPRRIAEWLVTRLLPDDRKTMAESLALSRTTLEPWRTELRWRAADDDDTRWIVMRARPSRHPDGSTVWTGVVMDATVERRAEAKRAALEAKMLQAQKAESLGILAGGIAHDFNNLLVGVLANADLLEHEIPLNEESRETIGHIRASALRAAELTQQMLAYAGKGRIVLESVELAVLVREMLALLRSVVPRTISFDFHADPSPAFVEGDATQIRQVVMNLVTNASEAIGDRPGRVTVRVGVESAPLRSLALMHAAPNMPRNGPYAVLEVSDDGCGMDAALLGRIFDPFYSTKFTGRGLGLAALLGIVRAHRGGVQVITAPGKGTRFLIYLPLSTSCELPESAARAANVVLPPAAAARVLVVDDEEAVRLSVGRILQKLGYDVTDAADGAEALAVADGEHTFDLVLMDVTMPAMDGPTAAREMRARGVAVPIILMSGYAEEDLIARGVLAHANGFLKKPFEVAELAASLREQLTR